MKIIEGTIQAISYKNAYGRPRVKVDGIWLDAVEGAVEKTVRFPAKCSLEIEERHPLTGTMCLLKAVAKNEQP